MSRVLTFAVPWSLLVSDNAKYLSRRFTLTSRYRTAKQGWAALAANAARRGWVLTEHPVALDVVVTPPDRRRRDLNFSKVCKDGITASGCVWADDAQVVDERWRMAVVPDKATAGAWVTVRLVDLNQHGRAA